MGALAREHHARGTAMQVRLLPLAPVTDKTKRIMADNNLNITASASQESQIKRWFLRHPEKEITSLDALRLFGSMEFPKRVSTLVAQGLPISRDRTIQTANNKRVKAYYITRENAERYMAANDIAL